MYRPEQLLKGFPTNGSGQKHDGCRLGSQTAPGPQGLGTQECFFSTQPRIVFGLSI